MHRDKDGKRKVQKCKISGIILGILVFLSGLGLVFYPWLSNFLFEHRVDSEVNIYEKQIEEADTETWKEMRNKAEIYNASLSSAKVRLTDPFTADTGETEYAYEEVLNLSGSGTSDPGLMCFIEIPKIEVYLPVYHGTSEEVLERGIGHVEGSSLPIGGLGTHTVLSGHTGINSARLFTDLIDMEEGDLFFLHVLGETLAYRVVQIQVIEPDQTECLKIDSSRDLVSLITCTPYGVNSHRLVVTGERTAYTEEIAEEAADENTDSNSLWMETYKKAAAAGLATAAAIYVLTVICGKIKRRSVKQGKI